MTQLLNAIAISNTKHMPVILQTEVAECGLAVLAMIASWHGHEIDLGELRRRFSVSIKGSTFADLIRIAEKLDLQAQPVKVDIEHIGQLATPCILHWDMKHFVVLKKVKNQRVVIIDPAVGERILSLPEFSEHYTGVALEVSPSYKFAKRKIKPSIRLSDLWSNIRGIGSSLGQILALSVIMQILAICAPFFMQLVIDEVIVSFDKPLLVTLTLGFFLVMLVNVSVTAMRSLAILFLSSHLSFQLASNLFQHLLRLPLDYFEKRHIGDVVSRFGSNRAIKDFIAQGAVSAIVDAMMAVATLIMMFIYSPKLTLVVLLALTVYMSGRWLLYRPFRQRTEESVVVAAKSETNFMETVRGIQSIKIFCRENDRKNQWLKRYAEVINCDIRLGRFRVAYDGFNSGILGVENLIVVFMAASMVLNNSFSIGMMMAFITYKLQFTGKATALVEQFIQFRMLDVHLARLSDIVLTPPDEHHNATSGEFQITEGVPSLENISYRYSETEPYLFQDINLQVERGKVIALVGPSGSGKTTLMKIMLGLMSPSSGKVCIDGIDIRECGTDYYRHYVGAVMQNDQLLSGSIADNICFFSSDPNYPLIRRCAELAAINLDIEAMPMKYDSLVGDMGTTLSGGQKQRILLARALYRQPKILFLDEATSHLDTRLEAVVNRNIKSLGITTIMIAHRPDTISWADEVWQLEQSQLTHLGKVQLRAVGPA